jgi:hypothetical protein
LFSRRSTALLPASPACAAAIRSAPELPDAKALNGVSTIRLPKPAEPPRSARRIQVRTQRNKDRKSEENDMPTLNDRLMTHWRDVANLVLGLWLAISPWALAYMTEARPAWNALIIGVIIAVAAAAALIAFHKWEEWVNVGLAVWLIVAPFTLEFATHAVAMWNHIIVGLLVGILALWTAIVTPEEGLPAGS